MSGHSEQKADEQGTPGSLGLSGAETDRYGFLLGNGDTQSLSDEPCPQLVRHREMKWLSLMNQWDQVLEKKHSKIKGQCQKGIPASVRAKCWPLLCGATHRKEKNQSLYATLDSAPGQQTWIDVIKRDTDRQFPFHEMFLNKDSHGQQGLLRVLKAYTQFRPEEGYCQAQGPVAAVLLMNMPMEEAFWCLVQISELYLPGYYSPLLEGVLFDAAVLSSVLKRTCPAAYKHLHNQGVEPLMFATDWLMCLYSRHLPFNTLLRVWDLFFCYGVRVLFQVAVVLVRRCLGEARQRKECEGQMETLERLRGVRGRVQHEPADAFIQEVCSVPLSLGELQRQTEKELEKWRKERPGSTFDPRDRCHGYHMVWEKGKEKEKENEKRERQSGNLTVPVMRSHSSLSPAILRKKWRKRGSKAETDEWDGGGRRFSQGVKEESCDGEQRRRSVCSAAGEFRAKTDSMTHETDPQFRKDSNTLTDTHVTQHGHMDTWSTSELSEHDAPVFEEDENDPPENVTQTDCGGHDQPSEKDLQTGNAQEETETQTTTCQSQDSKQSHQDKEKEELQTESNNQDKESHHEHKNDETQQVEEPQTQTSQQEEETRGNDSSQEHHVIISEQERELQVSSTQAAEIKEDRNIQEDEISMNKSNQEKEIQLNASKQEVESQTAEMEENCSLQEEEIEVNRCKQEQERMTNINKQEDEVQTPGVSKLEKDVQEVQPDSCEQQEEVQPESCKQEEEVQSESCKQEEEVQSESCKQEEEVQSESCKQEEEVQSESCKQEEEVQLESCRQKEEVQPESCKQEEEVQPASCRQKEEVQPESCKQEEEVQPESCKQEEEVQPESCKQKEEVQPECCKQKEEVQPESCKQKEEVQPESCKQEEEVQPESCKQKEEVQPESCKQKEEVQPESCKQEEEVQPESCKQKEEVQPECCKQKEEVQPESYKQEEEVQPESCKQKQEIDLDSCKQEEETESHSNNRENEVHLEEVAELGSSGQEVVKNKEQEKETQVSSSEQEVDVQTASQQEDYKAASSNEEDKKQTNCVTLELDIPEEKQQEPEDAEEANKEQQVLDPQTSEEQEKLHSQTTESGLEGAESELSKEMEKEAQITDKPEESGEQVVGEKEIMVERKNEEKNSNHQSADDETVATCILTQQRTASSQVVECSPQTDDLSNLDTDHTVDEDMSHKVTSSPSTFIHIQQETEPSGTSESSQIVEPVTQEENLDVTTVPEVQPGNLTHCEVSTTPENPEPQQPTGIIEATDMQTQNDPVSEQSQSASPANLPKSASSNPHFCLRRSSSLHTSYPTILSEDTFKAPHQSDEQERTTPAEATKAEDAPSTKNLTKQAQPSEAAPAKEAHQSKTHTLPQAGKPKRRGLFHRFRGEASPKATVPKILIQDFSEGEEKLSSKERRRRRREQERKEKEEEKERKKREKELEREKEKERKKPQTRGKSFQVLSRKTDEGDVAHGNSGSQTLRSKRNSAPHSESYF